MSVQRTTAITALILGLLGVASAIGLGVDKIATQEFVAAHARLDDIRYAQLAEDVKNATITGLVNAISADDRRMGDLMLQAAALEAATGTKPRAILDQVDRLQRANQDRTRKLNKLRD